MVDLHSKILDAHLPSCSNFLHFNTVFRNIWLNSRLVPPLWGWYPPLGNPGSATVGVPLPKGFVPPPPCKESVMHYCVLLYKIIFRFLILIGDISINIMAPISIWYQFLKKTKGSVFAINPMHYISLKENLCVNETFSRGHHYLVVKS